jgi:hypothetical protein
LSVEDLRPAPEPLNRPILAVSQASFRLIFP